jgi:hypothetical protein
MQSLHPTYKLLKGKFMPLWFNQSKKLAEILQRPSMSDEEFLYRLKLSSEVARKTVKCCRIELGKAYKLPSEKLYPEDIFEDIIRLPTFEWDMLELAFSLEEALDITIDEKHFPDWTARDVTLGKWIINFISRL